MERDEEEVLSFVVREVAGDGNCLRVALMNEAPAELKHLFTRKALAKACIQQLRDEMRADRDTAIDTLVAYCTAFEPVEPGKDRYQAGWWTEYEDERIIRALKDHIEDVRDKGKWLGEPIIELAARLLDTPIVVHKYVRGSAGLQYVVFNPPTERPPLTSIRVHISVPRAGHLTGVARGVAAAPAGKRIVHLLMTARLEGGNELGSHYDNLVPAPSSADGGAASGSGLGRATRQSTGAIKTPRFHPDSDEDHCSESSECTEPEEEEDDDAESDGGGRERKRPAAKAPGKQANKKKKQKKQEGNNKGKRKSPSPAKGNGKRKSPSPAKGNGKRKSPPPAKGNGKQSGAAAGVPGVPMSAGGLEQRVYEWLAPGGHRYVGVQVMADVDHPSSRLLRLCWELVPGSGPQLMMARLPSGAIVKAPGALDVPTVLPHPSTLTAKVAKLLRLPLGAADQLREETVGQLPPRPARGPDPLDVALREALPGRPVLAALRHDTGKESGGSRCKQEETFVNVVKEFVGRNAGILEAAQATHAAAGEDLLQEWNSDLSEFDGSDLITPADAARGAEDMEHDKCRPTEMSQSFAQIFEGAAKLLKEACDAARHLDEEHQPREVLRGLNACSKELGVEVRTNVMGTAMELTQLAALILKKEFVYTRNKGGQRPRVGELMYLRVPDRSEAEAEVVPPEDVLEDDPGHFYKPCAFISRAAPAIMVHMTDRDMRAVARAFAPGATEGQQAEFVRLLRDVMQKDVGWDILAVVRDKERPDELHLVWIQVKYRTSFKIPTAMLNAYLGKYVKLCERQQECLDSPLQLTDTSRNHFMWSSNQYRAGTAKAEFKQVAFYTMLNFEEDWGRHCFLEGLPQVVQQLVAPDTSWRDVVVGAAPPSSALEEQAGALRSLVANWGDPALPRGNVVLAPTGSGKTLMAQHAALLAPIADAAAKGGSTEELQRTQRLYADTLAALSTLHDQRTATHRRALCDAYHRMACMALVPVVMLAPTIHLCRQNLIAFYTQYHRWKRYLAMYPAEELQLPELRFALVCSDTEPVGDTGDIECHTCSQLPELLEHAREKREHVVVFTTVQGSPAFYARARRFALESGCAYGSTPVGRLYRGPANRTLDSPALIGLEIMDEAHKMCGTLGKVSTRAVSMALDLALYSLSLTATPLVLKARRDALAKAQLDELRERARRRRDAAAQAGRQEGERQAQEPNAGQAADVDDPCAGLFTDSEDAEEEVVNNSQGQGQPAAAAAGDGDEDEDGGGMWDELEEDLGRDDRDAFADPDPERRDAEEARRFLDLEPEEVVPQVGDGVARRTEDPSAAYAGSTNPERRFAADGRMRLCQDGADEFCQLLRFEPPEGLDLATAPVDKLASALCAAKNRAVIVVRVSRYGREESEWAYPVMYEHPAPGQESVLPGGVLNRKLVWEYEVLKTAAPDPPAVAEPDADAEEDAEEEAEQANNRAKRRRKDKKPRQGVLDDELCKDALVVGVEEQDDDAPGGARRLALFPYEFDEECSPPVGSVVHDQSGVILPSAQQRAARARYNFNGHGSIAHTIAWADAMRWRDRMPGVTDTRTVLPNRAPHESFVNYGVSTLDSMSEPRYPPPLPMDSPAYLARLVRRLFLRAHQDVDEAKFDVATALDAERGGKLWREEEDVLTDSDWTDLAELQRKIERAVRKGDDRCRILWVRCELVDRKYHIAEGGVPQALPDGADSLEHVLPLGYCVDEDDGGAVRVLFPTGAPRRRRPLVLKPALVLMNQPYMPFDEFAMDDFARNLFGVARQPGWQREVMNLEEVDAELRDLHAAVPFLRRALAEERQNEEREREDLRSRKRPNDRRMVKDRSPAWAGRVFERALEHAKAARVQFHTDRHGLGLPEAERARLGAAFDQAQNAVVKLREVLTGDEPGQQRKLLRALRGEADGAEKPRDATVAQPQQVKLRIRIGGEDGKGGKVFPCTLQHLLTAQMIVTAVTAPEPFRRRKLVVFASCNIQAVLLQMLFRAILAQRHPDVARQMYDAHVFSSMSLGGKTDAPKTQSVERNQEMLRAFARAELAVMFAANYLQEGWDCPSVDGCMIAYPCKSIRDVIQMCGRMMRYDSRNPDKTCALFVPVHDQDCVTLQDFSEERAKAVDALGLSESERQQLLQQQSQQQQGMVPVQAEADKAGIKLPFTPYQHGYDVTRKLLECMLDESVRIISRAFTLSHTRPSVTAGAHCEGPAVKAGAVTGKRLVEILMLRAAEQGRTEFMPIPVMCEQQVNALLDAAARLKLVQPARWTHEQVFEAWRQFRQANAGTDKAGRRPPRETVIGGCPLGRRMSKIIEQANGGGAGGGYSASATTQMQALAFVERGVQEFGVDLLQCKEREERPVDIDEVLWKATFKSRLSVPDSLAGQFDHHAKTEWTVPGRDAPLIKGSKGEARIHWFQQCYGQPARVACMSDGQKQALLDKAGGDFTVKVQNFALKGGRTEVARVYTHVHTGQSLKGRDAALRWHFAWTAGTAAWQLGPDAAIQQDREAWGPMRKIQTLALERVTSALDEEYDAEQMKGGETKYRPNSAARDRRSGALSESEARLQIFTRHYMDLARARLDRRPLDSDGPAAAASEECADGDNGGSGSQFSSDVIEKLSGIKYKDSKWSMVPVIARHFHVHQSGKHKKLTPKVPDPDMAKLKPFPSATAAYKHLVQRWAAGHVQDGWLTQRATEFANGHASQLEAALSELKIKEVQAAKRIDEVKYIHEPTGKAITGAVDACAFALAYERALKLAEDCGFDEDVIETLTEDELGSVDREFVAAVAMLKSTEPLRTAIIGDL